MRAVRWRIVIGSAVLAAPMAAMAGLVIADAASERAITTWLAGLVGTAFITGAATLRFGDHRWAKRSEVTVRQRGAIQEHELACARERRDERSALERELADLRVDVGRLEERISSQGQQLEQLDSKLDEVLREVRRG